MNHKTPLVSIIVPIFNTEKYLKRCLQSLLESTLNKIEIICVDDASTDGSADIAQEFVFRDPRVNLIRHKENLGLGGARNTGIRASRAAYIGGVDSDDWVAPRMYELLYDATDDGRADVVEGGYVQIDSENQVLATYTPKPRRIENDRNQMNIFEDTRPSFCLKLWRRSLFVENSIWFPEKTFYEDLATTPRILAVSKDIRFIEDSSYFYFKRNESITMSASEKHQLDHFKCFDILLDFISERGLLDRYRGEFETQIDRRLFYHAKNVLNSTMSDSAKYHYVRQLFFMARGYKESYVQLQGVTGEHIANLMVSKEPFGKDAEFARMRDQLAEKIRGLGAEVEKKTATLNNARIELDSLSNRYTELRTDNDQLRKSLHQSNMELESLSNRYTELRTDNDQLRKSLHQSNMELESLSNRYSAKRRKYRRLIGGLLLMTLVLAAVILFISWNH
jgi:glycosyltransferase involved in cell wall biosynthesis